MVVSILRSCASPVVCVASWLTQCSWPGMNQSWVISRNVERSILVQVLLSDLRFNCWLRTWDENEHQILFWICVLVETKNRGHQQFVLMNHLRVREWNNISELYLRSNFELSGWSKVSFHWPNVTLAMLAWKVLLSFSASWDGFYLGTDRAFLHCLIP